MAMTVSYSVVPRKNPAKRANRQSIMHRRRRRVSWTLKSCAKRSPVVLLVRKRMYVRLFRVFFTEVKRALKAGRIARLGDLGSLQIGLNSEGAASVKEFSGSMIKGAHLIFRPGKTLAELMKILSYQQVLTRAVAQAGAGDGGEKTLTRIRIPVVMAPVMKRLRTLRYNWQTGQGNNELE